MKKIFRYRLKVGSASPVVVNPIPSGDAAIVNELVSGQQFHRSKINARLTFAGTDFDLINNAPLETEFQLQVQKQEANNSFSLAYVLKFYKTDITKDTDPQKRQLTVNSTEPFDLADEFLASLDKELNLIPLAPATTPVNYRKQAVLQVYLPGSNIVANYHNGYWWETPVTAFNTTPDGNGFAPESPKPTGGTDFNDNIMVDFYGFGVGRGFGTPDDGLPDYARIVISGNNLEPDVSGVYKCDSYSVGGAAIAPGEGYTRADGQCFITKENPSSHIYQIKDADGNVLYESDGSGADWWQLGQPPHTSPIVTFSSLSSDSVCQLYGFMPFARLLTDKETLGGMPTVELPTDTPFPSGVFKRALPIETKNFIYSSGNSTTPTEWGRFSENALHHAGKYFVQPVSTTDFLMPLLQSTWTGASAWFYMDDTLRDLLNEAGENITCKDAYKLSDVLKVLLPAAGATNLTHIESPANSNFFYAPSNPIRGTKKVPVLIPLSNILQPDYDSPAKRAMIRMSEIMQLFANFHNVYPYIGEGILKLEHFHYFDNGGSYTGEVVGADATKLIDTRHGLPQEYGQRIFSYEKQNLPERIESGWAGDSSFLFAGFPIDVLSLFVQKGNVQDGRIGRFVTDIDFINITKESQPTAVFLFAECIEETDGSLTVPIVEIVISASERYKTQNGYASFAYAHDKYMRHGLPAPSVRLNKQVITATTIKRSMVQNLNLPGLPTDIDPKKLIKTSGGNARIESLTENMAGGYYSMKLRHKPD